MQTPRGGGSGQDYFETSAVLETDLDLAALSAHYPGELTRAGWRQLDAGASGPVAWSLWSFTDKEDTSWQALLFILRRPGRKGTYALTLPAETEDDGQPRGPMHGVHGVVQTRVSSSATVIGTQWHTGEVPPAAPAPETKPPTGEGGVG